MSSSLQPTYGLVLDIQGAQSIHHAGRGIGRFVMEHARALLQIPGVVRTLALSPYVAFPGHLPAEMLASPLLKWAGAATFKRAQLSGPVAYYVMSPFELGVTAETMAPPDVLMSRVPLLVTLYDLIPLLMPERYLVDRDVALRYNRRLDLIRSADLVLAISERTRKDSIDLLRLDPGRVVAIGGGVTPYFHARQPWEDPLLILRRTLPEVKRPFVFSVTGADDRKNTEALVSAYARLPLTFRREHQLVITCFMPLVFEQKWRQHARQVGLREDEVLLTNLVAEDVLRSLYQTAALFVFPSLYEGFGLPVAEAIACGCPTITSSVSSIPEILDWEPSTFDPSNPDAISCAIERGLSDHEFRDGLRAIAKVRAPIHTWGTVAERTVAAMAKLPKPPTAPRSKPALRLALVGPLPPARSGIADYNARLAAELAKHCQLDLLSDVGASHVLSETLHGVRRFPTRALGRTLNPASYDAIIYTIGGSEHHHDTYEAAARYPGIVWFHDIRLDGLYRTYALARQPSGGLRFLMEKAAQAYGQRLPQHFGWNGAAYDPEAADRFGLFLTRELVSWARGVIVNSDCAARLVELDQGPDASFQPIRELPFAVPTRIATTHRPYEHHPVIASFGVVHKVKGPKHLINALRHVRATVPARLVFVGDVSEVLLAELTELTGQLGLNDSVEFTGHVSQVEYERYLHEASCAIQLRLGMLGQNSAALSDCLSIGLPTITDIVATNDEFANYAIVRLSPTFDESDLASQAVGLLTDPVMWQQYHCGALDHARGHTFDHVAVSLVDIVRDLVHSSR